FGRLSVCRRTTGRLSVCHQSVTLSLSLSLRCLFGAEVSARDRGRRAAGSAGVPPAVSRVPRDTSEHRKSRLPEKPSGEISEMAHPSPFDVPGGTPGTAGGTPALPAQTNSRAFILS